MADRNEGGQASHGSNGMDHKPHDSAGKGGQNAQPEKRALSTPDKAAEAGRKGGESVAPEKRSFAPDPELAAEAGRKGGEATAAKRKESDGGAPRN